MIYKNIFYLKDIIIKGTSKFYNPKDNILEVYEAYICPMSKKLIRADKAENIIKELFAKDSN